MRTDTCNKPHTLRDAVGLTGRNRNRNLWGSRYYGRIGGKSEWRRSEFGVRIIEYTVVPALGDPRRERPPAVCGHFVNVPTHFKVKLPVISGTCLTRTRTVIYWLSAPAITDSAHKCHVFGGHFNQKSLACTQTCVRQISQISVLSSGDYDNACIHLASPACPSVPVTSGHLQCTYGHFCLVPRVSVHDRYYCTAEYRRIDEYSFVIYNTCSIGACAYRVILDKL